MKDIVVPFFLLIVMVVVVVQSITYLETFIKQSLLAQ
jgi:hypothetical protein